MEPNETNNDGEQPLEYMDDDIPDSAGTWIDRLFWWLTRHFLPVWLDPTSRLAHWWMDQIWIDCPWCLHTRGIVLGFIAGTACGILFAVLTVFVT